MINYKKIFLWSIIVSLIVSIFVIFAMPYISDDFKELSFRLLIAFCIFFGTVIIILLILLFRKKETQEMLREKALRSEYKKSIDEKVKNLKQKFNHALKVVKRASVYKFKSQYELPWYLVMGENSEGKTSFIEYSGLDFPINYEDRFTDDEDSFKWYFAEKSIFVDLPGNYIAQTQNPEDPIIWKYFLNFFIKRRWRRPINGIVLSISVDTLINRNNKDLENFAKQLRDRFDELSRAFMSSIPIYLLITKSDKIEGFNEYFNSLSKEEKDEILGVTFVNENLDKNDLTKEFSDLTQRLNSSVIEKMHFEWDEKNRGKIFLFTDKISQLLSKVTYFVDICFSETRYRKPLMLRGVYFTTISKNYGNNEKPKALFVKRLLEDIIFEESEISKIDDNYRKKIKKTQLITYVASILLIGFVSLFMLNSFVGQNDKITNYKNEIQHYVSLKDKLTENSSFEDISAVLSGLKTLKSNEASIEENSLFNKYFFKFESNNENIKKLYYDDLLELLLKKVANQMEVNISSELEDFSKTWDNTKAYLMLELVEKREKKFLKDYMKSSFEKVVLNDNARKNLNEDWENLLDAGFDSYDINKQLVDISRNRLVELSIERLTYEDWKSKFTNLNLKNSSYSDILGEHNSLFSGADYKIQGIFTKDGYNAILKDGKSVLNDILLNNWVIGKRTNLTEKEKDDYYDTIMLYYLSDYRKVWYESLEQLNVVSHNEILELNEQLAILTAPNSPVINILKYLKLNTELFSPTEKMQEKINIPTSEKSILSSVTNNLPIEKIEEFDIVDVKSVKALREFFSPYHDLLDESNQPRGPLTSLFNEFNKTYEVMSSINGAVNSDYDSFKIISNRVHGKVAPMIAQLNLVPIQVKKWYGNIIQGNLGYIAKGAKSYIVNKYKKDVLVFYNERLKNRYPLIKESNSDVKLDDFNEFFRKDGILDSFYKNYVSGFIEIDYQSGKVKPRSVDGNKMNFSKEFVTSLIKAEKIRKAMFRNDGSLGFSLNIKANTLSANLATSELQYDASTVLYEHGPILTKKVYWPNNSSNSSVLFKLSDLTNKVVVEDYIDNNDWSIFKYIDKNSISKGENGTLHITYKKSDYSSSYLIDSPFSQLFLNGGGLTFNLANSL